MQIDVLELGPMANCTYLLSQDGNALLVDPAWDMSFITHTLQQKNLRLLGVFYTHGHFDHVKFSQQLLEQFSVKGYLEKQDLSLSGIDPQYLELYDGECHFELGSFSVHTLPTPGHTAGSVCLEIDHTLFTGDTLFPGACGRTDLPTSDPRAMLASLRRLAALPEDTVFFAGHSYDGKCRSTIGYERIKNPFMRNALRGGEE